MLTTANAQYAACFAAVPYDPDLERYAPKDIRLASLMQMTDDSMATPHDIVLLDQRRSKTTPCRAPYIQAMSQVNPAMANVWITYYNQIDQNTINLAQHKISWGIFVSTAKTLNYEKNTRQIEAAQQELVRRQAAAGMIMENNMHLQEINAANFRAQQEVNAANFRTQMQSIHPQIQQPTRLQTNCSSMLMGNMVSTNCN